MLDMPSSEVMHKWKTGQLHSGSKSGPRVKSQKQAVAIMFSEKRKEGQHGGKYPHKKGGAVAEALALAKRKASGGFNFENMMIRGSAYGLRHEGMINSSIPGRTDKLPMNVRSGSYVLPADIPSALGQGNTNAGAVILKKMFSSGPYGMPTMRGASRVNQPRLNLRPPSMPKGMFAKGGETDDDHVPIVAAGGEYIVHPDVVKDIGHGDINAGHKVLDKFVLNTRKKYAATLQKLPGPKK